IRNFPHLVVVARREFDPAKFLLVDIRGNAELLLGFAIPGIEVPILDRPIRQLTVLRLHLEIVWYEPEAGTEPMRRASGDAIVGAGERPRTRLDQIGLFRIGPIAEPALRVETLDRWGARLRLFVDPQSRSRRKCRACTGFPAPWQTPNRTASYTH